MNGIKRLERHALDAHRAGQTWQPPELLLPNSIDAIEAGRVAPQRQRSLFDTDSRAGRLERLLADVPAVAQKPCYPRRIFRE